MNARAGNESILASGEPSDTGGLGAAPRAEDPSVIVADDEILRRES